MVVRLWLVFFASSIVFFSCCQEVDRSWIRDHSNRLSTECSYPMKVLNVAMYNLYLFT